MIDLLFTECIKIKCKYINDCLNNKTKHNNCKKNGSWDYTVIESINNISLNSFLGIYS